jgi:hypothetical protein
MNKEAIKSRLREEIARLDSLSPCGMGLYRASKQKVAKERIKIQVPKFFALSEGEKNDFFQSRIDNYLKGNTVDEVARLEEAEMLSKTDPLTAVEHQRSVCGDVHFRLAELNIALAALEGTLKQEEEKKTIDYGDPVSVYNGFRRVAGQICKSVKSKSRVPNQLWQDFKNLDGTIKEDRKSVV